MSFSTPNPDQGTSKPISTQSVLNTVVSTTNINQIRGINPSGATGSGIPKQVTGLSSSLSGATQGTTSAVSVTFHRDPSDINFDAVVVYVTGYQGNPSPVQIASATESPITFVLNNTGEPVSLIVQAIGNGGSAPLDTSPTTGIQLPKSAAGGYGPTASMASTFGQIGSGTNTKANMTLASGSSLKATGTGINDATEINGVSITGTPTLGKIPIAQNGTSAVWADPVVQGVYTDGASVASPGSAGNLSTIQPVLVAGKNASGNMASLPITTNGVQVDGSAVTQPISASSLPLPTGAATAANQATEITSLATVASAFTEKATYFAAIGSITLPSDPTEIFNIQGNSGKTLKVRKIIIGGISSAAGSTDVWVRRRTAANTGGTSSSVTVSPADTANTSSSTVVTQYSANASALGTNVGIAKAFLVYNGQPLIFEFGDRGEQALVVRGTSEWISVTLVGDPQPTGAAFSATIEWTEE